VTCSLVGSLAALALLLQAFLGAPLAVRMLETAPLCGVTSDAGDRSPAPTIPHQHDLCLICHAGSLPPGLVPAAPGLPERQMQSWTVQLPQGTSAQVGFQFTSYRSRAPPALA
jgi:hypothetical protein